MFNLLRPHQDPEEGAPAPRDRSLSTRLAWLLLAVGALLIGLRASLATVIEIHGDGMAPTLLDGDHVLLVRGAWGIDRGDLVIYDPTQAPTPPATPLIPEPAPAGELRPRAPTHDPARANEEPLRNAAVLDLDDLGLDDEWAKVQRRSGVEDLDDPTPPPRAFRIGRVLAVPGDLVTIQASQGGLGLAVNGVVMEHKPAGILELTVRGRPDPSEDRREVERPRPRGAAFESIGSRRYQVLSAPGALQSWPGLALPPDPGPIELIADGYLIVADNRDDGACCDSRAIGFIHDDRLRGEIVLRLGGRNPEHPDIAPADHGLLWKP
jgi:signal peptidase I